MTQTLYAHMNIIKKRKKKEIKELGRKEHSHFASVVSQHHHCLIVLQVFRQSIQRRKKSAVISQFL
jgi:hypothetical protein